MPVFDLSLDQKASEPDSASYENFSGDFSTDGCLVEHWVFGDSKDLHHAVVERLKGIRDPEIPVNIYDLGLVYGIWTRPGWVRVLMTLTSPACPEADALPARIESCIAEHPDAPQVEIVLSWDPPWDIDRASEEVRLDLGLW